MIVNLNAGLVQGVGIRRGNVLSLLESANLLPERSCFLKEITTSSKGFDRWGKKRIQVKTL